MEIKFVNYSLCNLLCVLAFNKKSNTNALKIFNLLNKTLSRVLLFFYNCVITCKLMFASTDDWTNNQ